MQRSNVGETRQRTILGIDPGYTDVGYGVITRQGHTLSYVHCGTVSSRKGELPQKLLALEQMLSRVLRIYRPDVMAIEQLFFCKNQKTAIDVAQARGIVLLLAAQHRIPVVEYSPPHVKQSITSYGHATKQQVAHMVKQLLHLRTLTRQDDAVDALAIAICAAFHDKEQQ